MIEFTKIVMKNFFAVGNVPLEIILNSHKKTAIVGANASSKSSCILDSITFALFGKPFRKINKTNVINSINKGETLVEIYFNIGNVEYHIKRGLKPAVFEIYCDNKLINQDCKSKDYQDYLEKYILRTNYKSFTNVVILGSARYNPFMSLPPSDRREIIEDLLDIQIFSVMNVLVKDKLSKLKEQSSEIKYSLDLVSEKIAMQKQNIEQNRQNIQSQIEEKCSEIEKSHQHIDRMTKDIILIQKHIDVLSNKILDKNDVEKKKSKMISIESKIESNLKKIKKEVEFYHQNDNCPTCKQSIDQQFKTNECNTLHSKQVEMLDGLSKLQEEVVKIQTRLDDIKKITTNIQDHNSEIVKYTASISATQKFIQKEQKAIHDLSTIKFESNDDKLNQLQNDLKNLLSSQEDLVLSKKYYDYAYILLKDGGIKTKIIKQYIPILNKLINNYLSKFNFFVNFNIDENFNEVIKARYREDQTYNSMSEGEKLRIDLCLLFAFRQIAKMKNSVNTNLLIMDEILDASLDSQGIEHFFELLNFVFDSKTNIFIISHKGESLFSNFDRVLQFEKKKNFTKMKVLT